MKRLFIIGLLVVLVVIQFIRPEENLGEAEGNTDITHYMNVPENVMLTLRSSCYDCHSNRTNYPWYSKVNPVGWWLNHHIEEGKGELNFSDFSNYDVKQIDHKLEEIAEEVKEGNMPLSSYTLIHRDVILSDEQIKMLSDWVNTERQQLDVPQE
ncbi:heme-binding domain-containing protein [Catalinimonas niigatensis]|uniref:heme-binding domain-containing protein n=1 Tax=Catalinimonas niigatensis TaxID=1397264 RepID=UPI0026654F8D|nr:heme-binding domain-containing protein [Catalinimonas niigatensis]WPP49862.1 heme-binding domain-containing protein [Catalinimonas niigatensis]